MCGIAGVVAWDNRYRATPDTLAAMSEAIAHRGPDAADTFFSPADARHRVALAFRRLAILDPDPRAMQPFTIGRKTIVFNGEIYNFRALRDELSSQRPDYAWRTTGDTEVLLVALDAWGAEAALPRLNGMFALAMWDAADASLLLARDPMGQKPLYYAATPDDTGSIAFASELPALRRVPWVNGALDRDALGEYLRFGYVGGERSIYNQIRKLPPGTAARFAPGKPPARWRYFDPNQRSATANDPAEPADRRAHRLLTQAVTRQLVSDVPIGCFLSGGIDSSCVVAAATAALGRGKVKTFTVGFDDPRYDETQAAAVVAEHFGTDHHAFVVRPDAAADLPKLAGVFGEPFADSSALPTHYLARATRGVVTVALSGDGGDELFGGYDRYRAARLARAFARVPTPLRRLATTAFTLRSRRAHPKSMRAKAGRFFRSAELPPASRYASYLEFFDAAGIASLAPDMPIDAGDVEAAYAAALTNGRDGVQAALAADRVTYLPDDLLAKVDRASMLHALEVRSPFMDPEVVRFAAGLSTRDLLAGGPKGLLRAAFRNDVPRFVFLRKKMGFAVPIGDWLRDDRALRPMLHDALFANDSFAATHLNLTTVRTLADEHEEKRADHAQRLYLLLMLELWWRQH